MATLDLTLGALEVGILISTIIYGITTVQCFLYTERCSGDPIWLRIMVASVWIFETVHTTFTWIFLYSLTVTNYGRPDAIYDTSWCLAMVIPVTSFVGSSVQAFFALRVKILSKRLIIPIISWSGAILRFGIGVTLGVLVLSSKTIPLFFEHYQWVVILSLAVDAAVDILNTSSLCFYLLRRRSGFKAVRRLVDKLILYSVETGLLTSLCAVAILACSLAMQDNFVYLGIFVIYPKLFSNSLLTSLNTRQNLRRTMEGAGVPWISAGVSTDSNYIQPHSQPEGPVVALELVQKYSENSQAIPPEMSSMYSEIEKSV